MAYMGLCGVGCNNTIITISVVNKNPQVDSDNTSTNLIRPRGHGDGQIKACGFTAWFDVMFYD